MQPPPLLHVTEQASIDLRADAAFVHLTLSADKLFSGRAALAKAVELRRLVTALEERGIADTAVALTGATLDVSTGLFARSSSVTYRLRIHVTDLERVPDVLDAIACAKQATLTHVEWDYSTGAGDELLATCAHRALTKAQQLAAALGATLAGPHEIVEEQVVEPPAPPPPTRFANLTPMRAKAINTELAGLDLAPTRKLDVRIRIAFRIA